MRKQLSVLFLISFGASLTNAQIAIDTERIPPEYDSNDLYRRAAASRVVVVGTVAKSEGVSKRLSQADIDKMKRPAPSGTTSVALDGVVGGSLYAIDIENTVCRQADFRPSTIQANNTIQSVFIFVPRDEPMFTGGHQRERLVVGERYLLFLTPTPPEVRKKWVESFNLDRKLDYYRTEQLSRGVVPLRRSQEDSKKAPSVLERLTQLCRALRPPELAEKLEAVRTLARSDDPVLRREAIEAETALQAQTRPQK